MYLQLKYNIVAEFYGTFQLIAYLKPPFRIPIVPWKKHYDVVAIETTTWTDTLPTGSKAKLRR